MPRIKKIQVLDDSDESRDEILHELEEIEVYLKENGLLHNIRKLEDQEAPGSGVSYVLFHIVMELIGNALRANFKRQYFQDHGYDFDDPESYSAGMSNFRNHLQTRARIADPKYIQKMDMDVQFETDLDHKRLITWVTNNNPLADAEEARIREKLQRAMNMPESRLIDYYSSFGDFEEGTGLGLAMIVFLIKKLGFDPRLFRVFKTSNRTIARIELPLSQDYTPLRHLDERRQFGRSN